MTCLVGIEHNGVVYLGADRKGSNGYTQMKIEESKIIKSKNWAIATCGSPRMTHILSYSFKPSPQPVGMADHEYLCTVFASDMKKCFTDNGFGITQSDWIGGFMLVAYNGRLYQLESNFAVMRQKETAEGSGRDFAKAVLMVTKGEPKARIRKAIKIASELCVSVGFGCDIVSIGKVKK